MIGLDTSVVVRLLVGEPAAQAARARDLLDELFEAGAKAAVSDLVVSEAYFALQYHYRVPKREALDTLRAFLQSEEIEATGAALAVLQTPRLASARPGFVDRLIHQEYAQTFGAMASFEKSAGKLDGTRVL
jgi:predicted nucleic-acid-binding protein